MEELRFPVGRYHGPGKFDREGIEALIKTIAEFPDRLTLLLKDMTDDQLDTPYRPEGWTVRQVVHHCADSHLHAYLRFKRIITEDNPTILPYDQVLWANLADSLRGSIQPPLSMLQALHARWTNFLRLLSDDDFARIYTHPEHSGSQALFFMLGMYAWHSNHHYGHIESLAKRKSWI